MPKHRMASRRSPTAAKSPKRSPVPEHALPFVQRFKELVEKRCGGTTALAREFPADRSMLSKIINGKVPMPEAWLTGAERSPHGGKDNRAISAKSINILDVLRLKGEERDEFLMMGLLALGPASLLPIVDRYRRELVKLRAQARKR